MVQTRLLKLDAPPKAHILAQRLLVKVFEQLPPFTPKDNIIAVAAPDVCGHLDDVLVGEILLVLVPSLHLDEFEYEVCELDVVGRDHWIGIIGTNVPHSMRFVLPALDRDSEDEPHQER